MTDEVSILTEEIDEETLAKMPFWFKIVRERYRNNKPRSIGG